MITSMQTKWAKCGRRIGGCAWFMAALAANVPAAQSPSAPGTAAVTPIVKENRNRANVLLLGDAIVEAVALRVQARLADDANFYRPVQPAIDTWLGARTWHAVFIALAPGGAGADENALCCGVRPRGLNCRWARRAIRRSCSPIREYWRRPWS